MPPSRIERIHTVTTFGLAAGEASQRQPLVSFGVAASDGQISWGDCLIPAALAPLMERSAIAARLRESTTSLLVDQSLVEVRTLWARVSSADEPLLTEPGVRSGVQQALLAAVVAARGEQPAVLLAREYGLPPVGRPPRLVAEVPDYAATAELFSRVLASAADGVGYRLTLAESGTLVGRDATDIQRFTRELKERATTDGRAPELYLALNGALGQLAGDPRRETGKIGGMLVGLERAAAPLRLVVEDPVRLDDATTQIAVLKQLEEFLRFRKSEVRLATSAFSSVEDVEFAATARAAHMITLSPLVDGDVDAAIRAAAEARLAGAIVCLAVPAGIPQTKVCFLVDVASAVGAEALLLGIGPGNSDYIRDIAAYSVCSTLA